MNRFIATVLVFTVACGPSTPPVEEPISQYTVERRGYDDHLGGIYTIRHDLTGRCYVATQRGLAETGPEVCQ